MTDKKEVTERLLIPNVVKKTSDGIHYLDLFSRLMDDRIIFIHGFIDSSMAQIVLGQLLYLESENENKPIKIYINSVDGEFYAGLSIIDAMNASKCQVNTMCTGMSVGIASVILSNGDERKALKHSTIMINSISGGFSGQETNVSNIFEHFEDKQREINQILADNCNKTLKEIEKKVDRHTVLSTKKAIEFGIIDDIIESKR